MLDRIFRIFLLSGEKADDKDKNGDNDEDLQKDYQLLRAVDTIKALSIYAADKK